tara:strand:+ start:5301 stop:5570 length:270 start_codon:yes stop_codon:yes gene_type:complete
MFAVYDTRDMNVWGAGATIDEAWGRAKEEVSAYIAFLKHHNQKPDLSMDDLMLHFLCAKCTIETWQEHVTQDFPPTQKVKISGGILETQ